MTTTTTVFDWPERMRQMADFVGLVDDDLALIRASRAVLLPCADELAAAVYEHFLAYPATARYFLHRDGAVNETRLARRKHSLARWLRNSIDFEIDDQFPVFLLAVGVVHSNPPLPAGRHGSVPARFMTGSIRSSRPKSRPCWRGKWTTRRWPPAPPSPGTKC